MEKLFAEKTNVNVVINRLQEAGESGSRVGSYVTLKGPSNKPEFFFALPTDLYPMAKRDDQSYRRQFRSGA